MEIPDHLRVGILIPFSSGEGLWEFKVVRKAEYETVCEVEYEIVCEMEYEIVREAEYKWKCASCLEDIG